MPVLSRIINFILTFYKNNKKEIDNVVLNIVQTIAQDTINKRKSKSEVKL